jgi:hypothetical protein
LRRSCERSGFGLEVAGGEQYVLTETRRGTVI